MKNKVKVTAQSFCPKSGTQLSEAHDEIVDLKDNVIFKSCKTLTDVQETYERFWNRLPTNQREMVLVQRMEWAN